MIRASLAIPFAAVLGALAAPSPSHAAEPPPERITALVVYGDDPCPQGKSDEIVVCARKPESERYRIPKALRNRPAPQGGSGWASQVAEMDKAGRALQPGSCSVIGSNGFTGCTAAMLRQWFAERRMDAAANTP